MSNMDNKKKEKNMGKMINQISCEECGSSDANGIYEEDKGRISSYCYSCGEYKHNVDKEYVPFGGTPEEKEGEGFMISVKQINELPTKGLKDRQIVSNITKFYGLKVANRSDVDGNITEHYYPYTRDGKVVGYQEREVINKKFQIIGKPGSNIELQGQSIWSQGNGKHLIITEGFLDAMAASQLLYGTEADAIRHPVVSLPSGATNLKCIQHNIDWINTFGRVTLMLDQDDAGNAAAEKIAKFLDDGKVHIAKFSEKDACDMLKAKKSKEFCSAFWDAPQYKPSGILTGGDYDSIVEKAASVKSVPYPDFASELNVVVGGKRQGEITLITAGTGVGKTQFLKEDQYDLLTKTNHKIGIVSLEESPINIIQGFQSLVLGKRVNMVGKEMTKDEAEKMRSWFVEDVDDRLMILDHQGSTTDGELLSKIKFMAACGCEFIYVDHITIAVSEAENTNAAIDAFMNGMLNIVKKFPVWIGLVSHLRKVGSGHKNFEQGGVPTLDDLKGSGAIKQVSFDVIALCRNQQHEDPAERNKTKIHVLKSRYTGLTGPAGAFSYEPSTGRLTESEWKNTDKGFE